MKLEVGGKYELNNGDVVECVARSDRGGSFEMDNGYCYRMTGYCYGIEHKSVKHRIDTPETGTLEELNVKAGGVVEDTDDGMLFKIDRIEGHLAIGVQKYKGEQWEPSEWSISGIGTWRIISRASDTPKTWGDMTDAERKEISFDAMSGKEIQVFAYDEDWIEWDGNTPLCEVHQPIRSRPEPVREVVTSYWCKKWGMRLGDPIHETTHRITFETVKGEDGEMRPDCATIKMEEL